MSRLGGQRARPASPDDGAISSRPARGSGRTGVRRRFVAVTHNPIATRAILLLALSLTGLAWWLSHLAVEGAAAERFEFRSHEIETAIVERMESYEAVLWSGAGLFDASGPVSREQFAAWVAALEVNDRWPGIQGVGFAVPVEPDEVVAHEAAVRAEGFPEYAISPAGDRASYSAIVYLEPFDWRNQRAFGFDMWSNPERRDAMRRARDSGLAATSSMITLVQETEEDVQRGFLTYVPVYRDGGQPDTIADRRAGLVGWVYAPFRMHDLMAGVLGSSSNDVDYQIFDGRQVDPSALLHDSSASPPPSGSEAGPDAVAVVADGPMRQTTVLIQGHPWTMVFRAGAGFDAGSEALPTIIALAGLVVEVVLFFLITALGSLNRRAESLAAERTAELRVTNEVLEQRSEELERQTAELRRSNDELRQFARVASHDLQEPLRTMASYSSLITTTYGDAFDPEGRRWLGYINDSAKRLSDLVREILQFSTIDQLNQAPIGVDLNHIMDAVEIDLAEQLREASAEVTVGDLPTVAGDPVQLRRLLTNLVHNAVTYRRTEVPLLVVVKASDRNDRCRIAVSDNGIGIDPDFQQRIFELFRRAAPRTEHAGTGLGLAICRKIVQAHGGDIGVVSSPGHGTEFWFELPVFDPDPGTDRAEETTDAAVAGSATSSDRAMKESV